MKPILKYSLLVLALSLTAVPSVRAHDHDPHRRTAPEVDPALAISGLALLFGSLSVAHARRSKG